MHSGHKRFCAVLSFGSKLMR